MCPITVAPLKRSHLGLEKQIYESKELTRKQFARALIFAVDTIIECNGRWNKDLRRFSKSTASVGPTEHNTMRRRRDAASAYEILLYIYTGSPRRRFFIQTANGAQNVAF